MIAFDPKHHFYSEKTKLKVSQIFPVEEKKNLVDFFSGLFFPKEIPLQNELNFAVFGGIP